MAVSIPPSKWHQDNLKCRANSVLFGSSMRSTDSCNPGQWQLTISTEFPVNSCCVRMIQLFLVAHGPKLNANMKLEGEDETASLYAALLNEAWICSSGPR